MRIEEPFQKQDRLFPSDFAQMDGRFDFDQGESVRIRKGPYRPFKPVSVGVGLDDGPDFRPGDGGTDDGKIVLHGSDIDTGNKWSGHEIK